MVQKDNKYIVTIDYGMHGKRIVFDTSMDALRYIKSEHKRISTNNKKR